MIPQLVAHDPLATVVGGLFGSETLTAPHPSGCGIGYVTRGLIWHSGFSLLVQSVTTNWTSLYTSPSTTWSALI